MINGDSILDCDHNVLENMKTMENKPLTLAELQSVEFETLKVFRDFCNLHSLRYYLCGGTLIGAVRHKGFIPWDDDIDVMMPRPDYEKFIELNKSGHLDENRIIDEMSINAGSLSSVLRIYDNRTVLKFAEFRVEKTMGCWIDVFPIDGMSSSEFGRKIHCRISRFFQDVLTVNDTKLGRKRRSRFIFCLQFAIVPILPFVYMVGHDRWVRLLDRIAQKYKYEESDYVGVVGEGRALEKEAMLKSKMEPPAVVEFWNEKFTAMGNYDEYLTNLYGDYMTPPKEAERESRHLIEVYWK